jgi:hypothetical protein
MPEPFRDEIVKAEALPNLEISRLRAQVNTLQIWLWSLWAVVIIGAAALIVWLFATQLLLEDILNRVDPSNAPAYRP